MNSHNNHVYLKDYLKTGGGSLGGIFFIRALVYSLVFSLVFLGVPLPIPKQAPRPLEIAKEALDTKQAEAVQIKKVQTDDKYIPDDSTGEVIELLEDVEDTKKTMVLLTNSNGTSGDDGNELFTPYFEDVGNVAVARERGSNDGYVRYHAVEFVEGVKVLHGFSSMSFGLHNKEITLTETVDVRKSFVLVYTRGNIPTTTDTEAWIVKADLIDGDTLKFSRLKNATEAGRERMLNITYQVVEFETDAKVQANTATYPTTIPFNGTSATVILDPHPYYDKIVDVDRAFLVFSFMGGKGIGGYEHLLFVKGTITNDSELTFTRQGSGSTNDEVDIKWYLVELTDPSSHVQSDNTPMAASSGQAYGDLNDLTDSTRTVPFISLAATSGVSRTYLDDLSVRAFQSAPGVLTFERGSKTPPLSIDWFAVEFGPLKVMSPNGVEGGPAPLWGTVGDTKKITWVHADSVETHALTLEYSADGGNSWEFIDNTDVTPVSAALDEYDWTIPATLGSTNVMSTNARIKITDTNITDPTRNYDESNWDSEIRGSITVTTPNGEEEWKIGDTNRNIIWDFTGNIGSANLYYSTDRGSTWVIGDPIAEGVTCVVDGGGYGGTESHNWNPGGTGIPDLPFATMRVKVESTYVGNNATVVDDASDEDFTISPKIVVTSPIDDEQWAIGTTNQIRWTSSGTHLVDIWYSVDNGGTWILIEEDVDGGPGKTYDWEILTDTETTTLGIIKILHFDDEDVFATGPDQDGNTEADGAFEIIPSLELTAPLGGVIWRVDDPNDITWNYFPAASIGDITISYSTTGGTPFSSWTPIVTKDVTAGTHQWQVPDAITGEAQIRIEKGSPPSPSNLIYDESENFFIKGGIEVTQPQENEVVNVGGNKLIQWNLHGSVYDHSTLNIALSYNGTTFEDIMTGITSGGSWDWNIPEDQNTGDTCYIKVYDPDWPVPPPGDGIADVSAAFALQGQVALTEPNGGEAYYIGNTINITWEPSPTDMAGNLRILYSNNGGTPWLTT
ncbi:hypothetical protein ACFL2Y_04500, partial [Candidatus Omnitrophota bacterium]